MKLNKTERNDLIEKYSSRDWRFRKSGMYHIINKKGLEVEFVLNDPQSKLLEGLWYLNIIPKARQLGISTFVAIFMLDTMLFNDNIETGIIDATAADAKKKLKKIKFAYDNLPNELKELVPKMVVDNKEEIRFSNGSGISVGTTHRGGTLNILHVSELAPIEYDSVEKAKNIITGALQTIDVGQFIFIESTAKTGNDTFAKYCKIARDNKDLTEMDFKLFFFPWWTQKEYKIKCHENHVFGIKLDTYFKKLHSLSIHLDREQMFWYEKKFDTLQEDIKQEYPSFLEEAFEVSDDDKYYLEIMNELRQKNRICEFEIDPGVKVDTYWDLGRSDNTSIIFSQKIGKEVRIVDFLESNGEHISFFIGEIQRKDYNYGTHYLPHDANNELLSAKKTSYAQVKEADIGKVEVVERLGVEDGIKEVKKVLKDCWFRKSTTKELVDHMDAYKKKWNRVIQNYQGQVHDIHSHSADAFRYLAVADKSEIESKRFTRRVIPVNNMTRFGG